MSSSSSSSLVNSTTKVSPCTSTSSPSWSMCLRRVSTVPFTRTSPPWIMRFA